MHWLLGDVTRPETISPSIKQVLDRSGRLDVLVNNAGVFDFGPIEGSSEKMMRTQFDINVIGLAPMARQRFPR